MNVSWEKFAVFGRYLNCYILETVQERKVQKGGFGSRWCNSINRSNNGPEISNMGAIALLSTIKQILEWLIGTTRWRVHAMRRRVDVQMTWKTAKVWRSWRTFTSAPFALYARSSSSSRDANSRRRCGRTTSRTSLNSIRLVVSTCSRASRTFRAGQSFFSASHTLPSLRLYLLLQVA